MSYKNLEIWRLANRLVIRIHKMTLEELPKFEMYEEAGQIRRSSKSTKSNIVEGYSRRIYKQEFLRFLIYSIGSNNETIDHLENLYNTKSLRDKELFISLHEELEILGKKLNLFIRSVESGHKSIK
ncbi:MAG: four helix bundle protein [Calditrichia bacterium]|nr:four helix bundle protein [Calditrichia bacterium]